MTAWSERPQDEARLFNPAFLAALLGAAVHDFQHRAGSGMPWLLSFLVLPLSLHAPTRARLPRTVGAYFPNWLHEQPEIRAGFPSRASALVPLTREAIRFGSAQEALQLSGQVLTSPRRTRAPSRATEDVKSCFKAAAFFGRWFPRHDTETLFALLGVRP